MLLERRVALRWKAKSQTDIESSSKGLFNSLWATCKNTGVGESHRRKRLKV